MFDELIKRLNALSDEVERLAALETGGGGAHDHSGLESTTNITLDLGDAAGTYEVQVRDSGNVEVVSIDSDGNIETASGRISAPGDITLDSGDDVIVNLGDASGVSGLRVTDSGNAEVASIDSDGNIETASGLIAAPGNITLDPGTDVNIDLPDASGVRQLTIRDSGGFAQATIDSDGNIAANGTIAGSDISASGFMQASGQVRGLLAGGGPAATFYANSATPAYGWYESDQAADERVWDIVVAGKTLALRTLNDANTDGRNIFYAIRGTGVGVASLDFVPKTTFQNGLALPRSSGSALFGIDASGTGSSITIADNATATPFGSGVSGGNFSGLVIINNVTAGINSLNICGGALIGQLNSYGGYFSTTKDNAGTVNVYYGAASNYDFTIQNKTGASVTLHIFAIRTRAGA